jgi:heme exporter protein A
MHFAAKDVTCIRGDRLVFADLSFSLRSGDALFLRGRNGSGKSSLLRIVAGLLEPAAGNFSLDAVDRSADPDRFRDAVAYVGHLDPLKSVLSIAENLDFWWRLYGRQGTIDAALARFDLGDLATIPARYLSAGQRRRVNLARLFVAPAPIWLLDEPTTGLDTASIAALVAAIAEHRGGGGAVMVATHIDVDVPGHQTLVLDAAAAGGTP